MAKKYGSYYAFQLKHSFRKLSRWISQPQMIVIGVIGGILLVVYVLFQSIYLRVHNRQYLIEDVLFTTGTIQSYDDEELFVEIVNIYTGVYYSTLRLRNASSKAIKSLEKESEFIDSINPVSFENNKLVVDVHFQEPLFRFAYNSGYYAAYESSLLQLSTSDTLGNSRPVVALPLYLSGTSSSIDGLLYEIRPSQMFSDYQLLQSSPVKGTISYIPGAQRYVIRRPELQVYFNAKKSLIDQLETLFLLKKHYIGFESLQKIDLGSLKQPIIK